jgi:hypothetical protein
MSEEGLKQTLNNKIFISSVAPVPTDVMEQNLQDLRELVRDRVGVTPEEVEQLLMRIVPTFKRFVPTEQSIAEAMAEAPVKAPV